MPVQGPAVSEIEMGIMNQCDTSKGALLWLTVDFAFVNMGTNVFLLNLEAAV